MSTASLDTCVLCCHESREWAIGTCNHPICLVCSARLRVLCKQNECPVCRLLLERVAVVAIVKPFQDLIFSRWPCKPELDYRCKLCPDSYPFRTLRKLKEHIRGHGFYFCEICMDGLKLFPAEFKLYSRQELANHWRQGDKDDSSHKGHPRCNFCDERYLDNDVLHKHLRKQHFWCHFCEAEGKQDYYIDCFALKHHFMEEHYLCEEGSCKNEVLTSAFSNEIDLKAHRASVHGKAMSKAEAKQARTLPVEFSYADHHSENTVVKRRGQSVGLPSYSRGFREQAGQDVQGPSDKPSRTSRIRAREEREIVAAMIESKTAKSSDKVEAMRKSSPVGRRKKVCAQSRVNKSQVSQDPSQSLPPPLPPPGFEKKADSASNEDPSSSTVEDNKTGEVLLNESWPELVPAATTSSPVRSTVPPPPGLFKKGPKDTPLDGKGSKDEKDCYSKKVVKKSLIEPAKEISKKASSNTEPAPRKTVLGKVYDKTSSPSKPPLPNAGASGSRFFEEIRKALGYDAEKFRQFQTLSGWYRNGGMSVDHYSSQCENLFEGQWAAMGPQLAKVMPPGQARENLILHFSLKASSNGTKSFGSNKMKGSKKNRAKDNSISAWVTVEDTGKSRTLVGGRRTAYSEDEYPSLSTSASMPVQPKVTLASNAWNVQVPT